jgi:hypothetical protein
LADAVGAIATIPATRESRWCSTADAIDSRSSTFTRRRLTENPASAAASSNAASSDAGPYSDEFCAMTPMSCDRPVTSARAALFGR